MNSRYELKEYKANEFVFDTKLGLTYSLELEESNAFYLLSNGKIKFFKIFKFSIFDRDYPVESDYMIRNTILNFLLDYFTKDSNEAILFFINNEFENNSLSRRGKSRIKLFRRLLRIANKGNNPEFIFLTNEHFILDHQEYKIDYIGIIIKKSSLNINNIIRSFNKFCHKNSYKETIY